MFTCLCCKYRLIITDLGEKTQITNLSLKSFVKCLPRLDRGPRTRNSRGRLWPEPDGEQTRNTERYKKQ